MQSDQVEGPNEDTVIDLINYEMVALRQPAEQDVNCASEMARGPDEVSLSGLAAASVQRNKNGWVSQKFCEYPIIFKLELLKPSHIDLVELKFDSINIPTEYKINFEAEEHNPKMPSNSVSMVDEVEVADPIQKFQVSTEEIGKVRTVVITFVHPNLENKFQQVGLTAVGLYRKNPILRQGAVSAMTEDLTAPQTSSTELIEVNFKANEIDTRNIVPRHQARDSIESFYDEIPKLDTADLAEVIAHTKALRTGEISLDTGEIKPEMQATDPVHVSEQVYWDPDSQSIKPRVFNHLPPEQERPIVTKYTEAQRSNSPVKRQEPLFESEIKEDVFNLKQKAMEAINPVMASKIPLTRNQKAPESHRSGGATFRPKAEPVKKPDPPRQQIPKMTKNVYDQMNEINKELNLFGQGKKPSTEAVNQKYEHVSSHLDKLQNQLEEAKQNDQFDDAIELKKQMEVYRFQLLQLRPFATRK